MRTFCRSERSSAQDVFDCKNRSSTSQKVSRHADSPACDKEGLARFAIASLPPT